MIKTVLLILFTLTLCFGQEDQLIKKDSDNVQRLFRGTSEWYSAESMDDKSAERESTKKAYDFISKYFDMPISSTALAGSSGNSDTDKLILNLKVLKKYKETDDAKKNSRIHVIIFLDDKSKKTIQDRLKNRQEYNDIKKNILALIEEKKYFQAKESLESAKENQLALNDKSITTIESRLGTLIESLMQAKITTNKEIYQPDETIEIKVSLNKEGYMYLFYETGIDVAMIFPNKEQRIPRLHKDEPISFPNSSVEKLIAYEDDVGGEIKFHAIASKTILPIKSLSEEIVDGIYIYDKKGKYKDLLNKCLDEGVCTQKTVTLKVSD